MKNPQDWKPTKYIFRKNKLIASRNSDEVAVSSRMISDLTAEFYQTNLKEHAKGKLLDLGCGKVPLYAAYKNFVTDNICVDWSNSLHKNPHLDFECNLNERLPFQDEDVDTIILSDVLEHLPEPQKLWFEMNRILKRNGKVLMNIPFFYWLHEEPFDYYRYTEFALRRFAEVSGFRVIYLSNSGGFFEIITDIFSKISVKIPLAGNLIASCLQKINSVILKTSIGKKIAAKTGKKFPLSYFMIAEKIK